MKQINRQSRQADYRNGRIIFRQPEKQTQTNYGKQKNNRYQTKRGR